MESIGCMDYGGAVDFSGMAQSACKLLDHIRRIRDFIGHENTRLLDDYLYSLLSVTSEMSDTFNTANMGMQADKEFHDLVQSISNGDENAKHHPLYPLLMAHMGAYLDRPITPLQTESLYVEVFHEVAEHSLAGFIKSCNDAGDESAIKYDLLDTREALSQVAGVEDVGKLDALFYSYFYLVSPGRVYVQAMLDQLVLALLTKDRKSGQHAFQRFLSLVG